MHIKIYVSIKVKTTNNLERREYKVTTSGHHVGTCLNILGSLLNERTKKKIVQFLHLILIGPYIREPEPALILHLNTKFSLHWCEHINFSYFLVYYFLHYNANHPLATDSSEQNTIALQALCRSNAKPRCPLTTSEKKKSGLNSGPHIVLCIFYLFSKSVQ